MPSGLRVLQHTDQRLSSLLGVLAGKRGLAGMPPLLIEGPLGCGKAHYLLHLTRQLCCSEGYAPFPAAASVDCHCPSCRALSEGVCPDFTELPGGAPIAELRSVIGAISEHQPTMLPKRVLLLRRLDRYSLESLETLLRVAEEPPDHVLLLATTLGGGDLPATIRNRFRALRMASLTPEAVDAVCATDTALQTARILAGGYRFRSIRHLTMAARLRFEDRFQEFLVNADFLGLERRVQAFLRDAESGPDCEQADVLEFFAEWLLWRAEAYCQERAAEKAGFAHMLAHLPGLVRMNQAVFARYGRRPNRRAYITPAAQFYSLISSLNLLRRAAVPA